MYPYPPIYPQPFDCRRPGRPPRPEVDCPWDLAPANMTATVLGVDSCGGVILRLMRNCEPACEQRPCDRKPCRPCR